MNSHDDLVVRQQRLLMRSAHLRIAFADQSQVFKRPLAVADQARAGLQWLYRNPQWSVGALVALLVMRPRRALVWSGRAWWAWRMYKQARNWIAAMPLPGINSQP